MFLIFPTHCLASPSGLMVGMKDLKKNILCVVAVVSPTQAQKLSRNSPKDFSFLGLWYRFDNIIEELALQEQPKLVLYLSRGEKLPKILCSSEEVVMIFYNHCSTSTLLTIQPLNLRSPVNQSTVGLTENQCNPHPRLPLPEKSTDSCIEEIINYINKTQDSKIKASIEKLNHCHVQKCVSRFLYWIWLVTSFVLNLVSYISRFLLYILNHAVFRQKAVRYLMSLSVLFKQFTLRLMQISAASRLTAPQASIYAMNDNPDRRKKLKGHLHQKQRETIIKGSLVTCIAIDVILGVAIVSWLTTTNIIPDMAKYLLQNTENVAQMLIHLIYWLMGVPAGLKLNKTLTNFLGTFFLYHIHLWQTYLEIIQPYLQTLLWMCILSGCLGMTFLISLASDVLSLLTLHIYCFYVYAARLYSLQVYSLLSLARLFTGKKLNILQNGVDSLPYDVDRLFIGTLLFTVLFFLLPTTALFYVVFTSLRLLVYVVKYFLSCAVHLVNKLPVFGLTLLVFKPSMLPGGLHIEILQNFSDQATTLPSLEQLSSHLPQTISVLYLKISNKPLSVTQLVDWSVGDDDKTDDEQDTWGTFLEKLLRGHLVYPWKKGADECPSFLDSFKQHYLRKFQPQNMN